MTLKTKKIAVAQIEESIKYLKNKKAPGLDNLTNAMTKCFDRTMTEHLYTLFNNIMESGYYPTSWNQGLICSIYKLGKKDDPNNYRGITLSNCLGKLFNKILCNELQMNLKKILFHPLPKMDFRKITELQTTSSHYSV